MDEEIKRTLEKQLQLLSERSKENPDELPELTHAMVEVIHTMGERKPTLKVRGAK